MQGLGGVDRVAILLSECRTIEVGEWVGDMKTPRMRIQEANAGLWPIP